MGKRGSKGGVGHFPLQGFGHSAPSIGEGGAAGSGGLRGADPHPSLRPAPDARPEAQPSSPPVRRSAGRRRVADSAAPVAPSGVALAAESRGSQPRKHYPSGPIGRPPGAAANGSRPAAGNIAGRRAGSVRTTPLRRSPPRLGADARTQAAGASPAESQTRAFNLCEAGAPRGLSRASAPAPRPVPCVNV